MLQIFAHDNQKQLHADKNIVISTCGRAHSTIERVPRLAPSHPRPVFDGTACFWESIHLSGERKSEPPVTAASARFTALGGVMCHGSGDMQSGRSWPLV